MDLKELSLREAQDQVNRALENVAEPAPPFTRPPSYDNRSSYSRPVSTHSAEMRRLEIHIFGTDSDIDTETEETLPVPNNELLQGWGRNLWSDPPTSTPVWDDHQSNNIWRDAPRERNLPHNEVIHWRHNEPYITCRFSGQEILIPNNWDTYEMHLIKVARERR